MITTISRWGNSLGIRIPKGALDDVQLREGDVVDVVSRDGAIVLLPRNDEASLDELIALITPDNLHAEQLSTVVGAERW